MRETLRYFLGIVLGLAVAAGAWMGVVRWQTGAPTEDSRWLSEIVQAKMAAVQAEQRPKFLVVGGSASLFGLNAKQIEAETGLPTINFGVHAGLGVRYLLHLARGAAKPGDTVLLIVEYEIYDGAPSDILTDYLYARDPGYIASLPLVERWELPLTLSASRVLHGIEAKRGKSAASSESGFGCYNQLSLDASGDETCNQGDRRPPEARARLEEQVASVPANAPVISEASLAEIKSFIEWCHAQNIQVMISFPNTVKTSVLDDPSWTAFFARVTDFYRAQGVPIIGAPHDFMYDESLFYDTRYHLNVRGVEMRTAQLIPMLKEQLAVQASSSHAKIFP